MYRSIARARRAASMSAPNASASHAIAPSARPSSSSPRERITSLLRARLPQRTWRATHYLSFPLFALTTIHGLSAGTDRHTALMRVAVFTATAAVVGLTALRVGDAERQDVTRPAPARPRAGARSWRYVQPYMSPQNEVDVTDFSTVRLKWSRRPS